MRKGTKTAADTGDTKEEVLVHSSVPWPLPSCSVLAVLRSWGPHTMCLQGHPVVAPRLALGGARWDFSGYAGDRTGGQQRREDRKARTDRTNGPHCFTALPAGLRQPHVRTQASLLATSCLGGKPGVLEHASTAGSSTHCFLPPAQASGTFSLPT